MSARPIVFLDIETDGLRPNRHLWDLAMIRRETDGTETTHQVFVPISLTDADPYALKVGRFYERHPLGRWLANPAGNGGMPRPGNGGSWPNYVTLYDAAHLVARVTHEATIVGCNPSFDTHTLERLLRSNGLQPTWDYHLCDVRERAIGWLLCSDALLAASDLEQSKTGQLATACEVSLSSDEDRHTALGDAKFARRWYDTLAGAQ